VNVHEANFQDLMGAYYRGTRAREAAAYLRTEIEAHHFLQLANLLRDYRERPIYSVDEVKTRAAVDDLMICYDVLEVAALEAFILPPDRSSFWEETQLILDNRQVRDYLRVPTSSLSGGPRFRDLHDQP
jgi:hypothetical protein